MFNLRVVCLPYYLCEDQVWVLENILKKDDLIGSHLFTLVHSAWGLTLEESVYCMCVRESVSGEISILSVFACRGIYK